MVAKWARCPGGVNCGVQNLCVWEPVSVCPVGVWVVCMKGIGGGVCVRCVVCVCVGKCPNHQLAGRPGGGRTGMLAVRVCGRCVCGGQCVYVCVPVCVCNPNCVGFNSKGSVCVGSVRRAGGRQAMVVCVVVLNLCGAGGVCVRGVPTACPKWVVAGLQGIQTVQQRQGAGNPVYLGNNAMSQGQWWHRVWCCK